METTEVYLGRYRCLANGREFTTAGFGRDLSQEYGQKYYVTEDGEAAIVNLLAGEPEGMQDLDRYVEELWDHFGPKDPLNGKSNVQEAAWRFFADLSRNGRLWYFQRMNGHPICGPLILKPLEEPWNGQPYVNAHSTGEGEKLLTGLQPVTFTKWLGLPEAEKQFLMQRFLGSPHYYDVRTLSDPIYPHPFHPDLGA